MKILFVAKALMICQWVMKWEWVEAEKEVQVLYERSMKEFRVTFQQRAEKNLGEIWLNKNVNVTSSATATRTSSMSTPSPSIHAAILYFLSCCIFLYWHLSPYDIFIYTHTHIHTYINIYTYIRIYIYIRIYVYIFAYFVTPLKVIEIWSSTRSLILFSHKLLLPSAR